MSSYAFGEPVTLTLTDANGATATLSSYAVVVLTIVQPDGTPLVRSTTDATLTTNPYIFAPTQVGRHVYYYGTTTPTGATTPQPFDVQAAGQTGLISLADAKSHLIIPATDTSNDVKLQGFIDAATDTVEGFIGPVRVQTFTEWHEGGGPEIVLHRRPVTKITSVVEYAGTVNYPLTEQSPDSGNPLDAFGFFAFYDSGLIQRTAYGVPSWFAAMPWWTTKTPAWFVATPNRVGSGTGRVKVVYTAGRTAVPTDVRLATLLLIEHLWDKSQYPASQFGTPPEMAEVDLPGIGAKESQAMMLLEPYRLNRTIG